MINVFIGKKNSAWQKKYREVITSFGKNVSVEKISLTQENFSHTLDQIVSTSLFGDTTVFVIEGWLEPDDLKKNFFETLSEIVESQNHIILVAEKLLAPDRKKIEPIATIYNFEEKIEKESTFNAFTLANTFATGDRKKTWITFQEVLHHDDEIEKIHGMIWWKIKDMMNKKNIHDSSTLKNFARTLVGIYHDARLGGRGITERLEEFFLTLPPVK